MRIHLVAIMAIAVSACSAQTGTANADRETNAAMVATVADTPAPIVTSPASEETTWIQDAAGRWVVIGVESKESPVQATDVNDAKLMGGVLTISQDRMAWSERPGSTLSGLCEGPQIGPDGTIGCAVGEFGPPGATIVRRADRITMEWYDGAILVLASDRRS